MTRPRLQLANHASLEELEQGYRQAKDPIQRSHWHIIWLFHQYQDAYKVAELTAYCADWVRKLVRRYNQDGTKALEDLRHRNRGNPRLLSAQQQEALEKALLEKAEGKSLWTGQEVARWVQASTGVKISRITGWSYLKRMDYSLQVPRPQHLKAASKTKQEDFKKNSKRPSKTTA
jgi:transposase